jgi:hypothetical protein
MLGRETTGLDAKPSSVEGVLVVRVWLGDLFGSEATARVGFAEA